MCLKMYTYVYYNTTFAKLFINTEIVLTYVQDESITAGYMQNLYKILTCWMEFYTSFPLLQHQIPVIAG